MDEDRLRWKGRIGALKSAAIGLALLAALALLFIALEPLPNALRNPTEPQAVSLSQLTSKEIGFGRYVTVSGRGIFGAGITETDENGNLSGFVYPVADDEGGALLYVRSSAPKVDAPKNDDEQVTISGIVRSMPTSIQALIKKDLPSIEAAGFATAPDVCLVQGQKPGNANVLILVTAVLGVFILLCLATLFFPHPVFGPHPVEAGAAPATVDRGVKATGRFQRLKRIDPALQMGKGAKRFREAPANIITLDDGRLMIYVRHVVRYGRAGIVLSTSHWGLFPEPHNVPEVQPGVVYGWRNRAAVRMCYLDDKGKAEDLILSFNHSSEQAEFVSFLQQRGFGISAGA